MAERVRCADCGLLAAKYIGNDFREVGQDQRRTWLDTSEEGSPSCFAMAASLKEELENLEPLLRRPLKVIESPRTCAAFTPWIQGFDPKEHKIMVHDMELRAMAERAREKEKEWQEKLTQSQSEATAKAGKAGMWGSIIGAIVGAAVAMIAGWLTKDK